MNPLPVIPVAFTPPTPMPVVPLEVGITPSSRGQALVILFGVGINGSRATYSDLNGLGAYAAAGGFDTRGARRGQINRYIRGNEDSTGRKA